MNTLQNNLVNWANRSVKRYIDLMNNENDYAFYTQSDLTKLFSIGAGNVDVMILGINPGSGGSYTAQKQNPGWHLNGSDMTGDKFLKGNYCTGKEGNAAWDSRKQWLYWKRLSRFFARCKSNPLYDETRFVLTNMCYFNTPKANQVSLNLLDKTKEATIELIDIVKPKRLVFLSGKNALQRLKLLKDFTHLHCNVYVGTYRSIPCLGIPHPSAYLSQMERTYISDIMAFFMNNGSDIETLSQIEQPILVTKGVRVEKNMRIADAQQVLQSFTPEEWNCETGSKGAGLRKDRDYLSFCNDAFELYSAETVQEHIQLFIKDTRLIERIADSDIDASVDENDIRGFKLFWPFRIDLYNEGYTTIVRNTVSELIKLHRVFEY
mgnify:CR=1 FL=1